MGGVPLPETFRRLGGVRVRCRHTLTWALCVCSDGHRENRAYGEKPGSIMCVCVCVGRFNFSLFGLIAVKREGTSPASFGRLGADRAPVPRQVRQCASRPGANARARDFTRMDAVMDFFDFQPW